MFIGVIVSSIANLNLILLLKTLKAVSFMHRKFFLILLVVILVPFAAKSLEDRIAYERVGTFMAYGNASVHISAGDLNDRFGNSAIAGGGLQFKTQSNWLFGADYGFLFGGRVYEDVLEEVNTSRGAPINRSGNLEDIDLQQRGHTGLIRAGRIFPVIGPNENSGLYFQLGYGLITHRINIHYSGQRRVPQIDDPYNQGYDRLTYGHAFSQSFGYFHFSNNNSFNFFLGFDFIQGLTRNQRDFNFDEMRQDDDLRTDLLFGLRGGIFFPFFSRFWAE